MRIRCILAAVLLAATPGFAIAQGCSDHGAEKASSCADGYVWDRQAGTCVEQVTS